MLTSNTSSSIPSSEPFSCLENGSSNKKRKRRPAGTPGIYVHISSSFMSLLSNYYQVVFISDRVFEYPNASSMQIRTPKLFLCHRRRYWSRIVTCVRSATRVFSETKTCRCTEEDTRFHGSCSRGRRRW